MAIAYENYRYRDDPRAKTQTQFTRASETYHTIPDSALRTIVKALAKDSRSRSARDQNATERRRSGEAESDYGSGSREGAGLGRQGVGRKPFATPESANGYGQDDEGSELEAFVRERLSPEDYEQFLELMSAGENEEEEAEDGEEDTPDQDRDWERQERPAGRSEAHGPRSKASNIEGEDDPAPFRGRPRTGGAADRRQALDDASLIGFGYPTAGDEQALRQARRAARRPKKLAMDKRDARYELSRGAGFFNRFPDAAKVGFR